MIKYQNRLASLFQDFTDKFELPRRIDPDGLGADLGIPDRDKMISAGYVFHPSGDSYEFGAPLDQVSKSDIPRFTSELLTSRPIRGITERIDDRGRVLVMGSRDGLTSRADADIVKGYMDDVARISASSDQVRDIMSRIRGRR